MNLIRDIEDWWAERHGRRRERDDMRRQKLLLQAELDLAEEEARMKEIERNDAMCKSFSFSAPLIYSKGKVARLKKIIEQHK